MKKVLLDAGHGGKDPGAQYAGYSEDDFNLELALETGRILERLLPFGSISYTRIMDKPVSLSARAAAIMDINPDAFVSIHCNFQADDPSTFRDERKIAKGAEIFYRDAGDLLLAQAINKLISRSDLWDEDRGIKQDLAWLGKRLTVLNDIPVPSVLIEVGFISNDRDRDMIKDHVPGIADLIAHGILDFLGAQPESSEVA